MIVELTIVAFMNMEQETNSDTVSAIITSWVSRPEFSASVLGITRRALAKASTPSWARWTDNSSQAKVCQKMYTNIQHLNISCRGKYLGSNKLCTYPFNSFLHFVDQVLSSCNFKGPSTLKNDHTRIYLRNRRCVTSFSWYKENTLL